LLVDLAHQLQTARAVAGRKEVTASEGHGKKLPQTLEEVAPARPLVEDSLDADLDKCLVWQLGAGAGGSELAGGEERIPGSKESGAKGWVCRIGRVSQ